MPKVTKIKTAYGDELNAEEVAAYRTLNRLIEKNEYLYASNMKRGYCPFADAYRAYFKESKVTTTSVGS